MKAKQDFSYSIETALIPSTGKTLTLQADDLQRKNLAQRLNIVAVESLQAEVTLKRVRKDYIQVQGRLKASVDQVCVVSLNTFNQKIEETFNVLFCKEESQDKEIDLSSDLLEETDIIVEGKIDVGDLVVQYLALSLDPFPKRCDVSFSYEIGEEKRENPFSCLEKLKKQ